MATATARMTIGSLLGSVSTAANTVTSTLDAASAGVGMLNTWVEDAAKSQRLRILKDQSTLKARLKEEHAQETAQRRIEVVKFCSISADHAKFYEAAYNEISAVLDQA